jgi:formylglycine-generating enzyme required for sulfatase activity
MKKILFYSTTLLLGLVLSGSGCGPQDAPTIKPIPGVQMVLIKAGTFDMGSTAATDPDRDADEIQHKVTISKDYYLSEKAITNAQYCLFLNTTGVPKTGIVGGKTLISRDDDYPWGVRHNGTTWVSEIGYADHPVIYVSWYGASAFCDWLSGKTGKSYRLPTEAEWEYACRAGTKTPFNTGNTLTTAQANYDGRHPYNVPDDASGSHLDKTVEVWKYAPNGWGLYQMHGNVYEWCSDWFDDYPAGAITDPTGPTADQTLRVVRGGNWYSSAKYSRSAFRSVSPPDNRSSYIGFRIAASL